MKKTALTLIAVVAAVSLSACSYTPQEAAESRNPESAVTQTFAQEVTPQQTTQNKETVSFELEKETSQEEMRSDIPQQSSEPQMVEEVREVTDVRKEPFSQPVQGTPSVSKPAQPKPTEPSVAEPTVQEESELPTASTPQSVPEPIPEPSVKPMPEPEPTFDVSSYVAYAKSCGQSLGLTLDSTAVSCWDDPLTANASCIYLERDIRDRLDWYAVSGFTAFWVWSEDLGSGNYLVYIGYA
ncbi:MAG: hypothetical protein O0V67_08350 [Methanocorpusculum sp.]|nr:hypothetical protein [Methanocorpusculum sp.]